MDFVRPNSASSDELREAWTPEARAAAAEARKGRKGAKNGFTSSSTAKLMHDLSKEGHIKYSHTERVYSGANHVYNSIKNGSLKTLPGFLRKNNFSHFHSQSDNMGKTHSFREPSGGFVHVRVFGKKSTSPGSYSISTGRGRY